MTSLAPDARPRYSISVAAELTGLHQQTLRVYEARGLVRPRRTPGGTRRYSEADLARLRKISVLTGELGMNLAGATRVLELEDTVAPARRPGGRSAERSSPRPRRHMRTEVARVHRSYRRELVRYQPPTTPGDMDFTKLTVKAQEAFASAQGDAVTRGNPELTPDHLLLALARRRRRAWPRASSRRPGCIRRRSAPRSRPGCRACPAWRARTCSRRRAARPARGARGGVHRGRGAQGRVRRRRAPAARAGRRRRARPGRDHEGGRRGARRAAGDLARRRGHLRGPAQVRARPDRRRRARQARPGHRPRPGGAPRHPGARRGARRTTPC